MRRDGTEYLIGDVADALEEGLAGEARRLDEEQSPYGLDALDEVKLHPVLAAGLRAAGYGVYTEHIYPQAARPRRESACERCDLVLTPAGRELHEPWREPTLFDPADPVQLDDAFWLEVKVVAQYTPYGPNARYSTQLLTDTGADVEKLGRNPGIFHAALLVVLFCHDEQTAEHDLGLWLEHCLREGLDVRSPSLRGFKLTDRLGNRRCSLGLYPVRPAAPS